MSLELWRTREGRDLVLRRQPYRPELEALDARAETTVLVEGVTQASFSYFGAQDVAAAPRWANEWRSPTNMPQLIRLSLRTDEAWPDVVAAVHNDSFGTSRALPGARPRPPPDEVFFLNGLAARAEENEAARLWISGLEAVKKYSGARCQDHGPGNLR